MFERIRLLPIVIVAAIVMFGFKVDQIRRGISDLGVAPAFAQAGNGGEEQGKAAGQVAGDDAAAEKPDASAGAEAAEKTMAANTAEAAPSQPRTQQSFTPAEVEVLQKLSMRREALEERSRTIGMREKLLDAAEKRIDEKIVELKKLEERISKLLQAHDDQTEEQLKSLVKVYENMKPKDAARIFEQLEMEILIDVTERMKETKMAPVLAAMDSEKAKALTVELATRRRLPKTGG